MTEKVETVKAVDPRVEVALDVLKLLDTKRITAASMVYFEVKLKRRLKPGTETIDVQKLLSGKNVAKCEVCAKGAMMVAFAMKHDRAEANVYGMEVDAGGVECNAALLGTFSSRQLENIERSYEGFYGSTGWLHEYPDKDARLRAIMQRIVDNGGEFGKDDEPGPADNGKDSVS